MKKKRNKNPEPNVEPNTTYDIWRVGLADVPAIWPRIAEIVNAHKSGGVVEYYDTDQLLGPIMAGVYDLWVAVNRGEIEGACLAVPIHYPKRTFYMILWCGGDNLAKYFRTGLRKLEQYACMAGYSEVTFEGRKGWLPVGKSAGYQLSPKITLSKNVQVLWS